MLEGKEVVSQRGVVAAEPAAAAQVGARILAHGGNAMDAASATAMACCMLQPASTGVGGYVGIAVIIEGSTGRVWSVDSNSVAPAAAHERMFEVLPVGDTNSVNEREYFCRVKDDANVYGPLAVGVPGMMALMGVVWERWGRLKWGDICTPSQKLLDEGFPYAKTAHHIKSRKDIIERFEPTAQHLMPDGRLPEPDDIWHRPDMEKTLARIAKAGWQDFYKGELGHMIADYIQEMGGILTREDMATFEPRITEPYEISFREAKVYGSILPNGCLTAMQILNMLDCFPSLPDDGVEYWHRFAEVSKLAWRDRLKYLADPDFVSVPVEMLLDKDYAMGRTEAIRQLPHVVDKDTPPFLGDPGHGTLHLSTADAEGNLVSMTISQGGAFGSCVTVPGTGLILGHGMCRLDPRPGRANSIAGGKRPLNNGGTMILTSEERNIAVGLPGGRHIVCVVPRMAQVMVEFGRSGLEAATAPRMHVTATEPVHIVETVGSAIIDGLGKMGHEVVIKKGIAGGAHIAEILKKQNRLRGSGNGWAAAPE